MTTDTDSKILKKLDEQEKEEGNLPLLLEFYRKLVQLQTSAQKRIVTPVPSLDREAIRARIQKGLPLVGSDDLALDWPLVQDIFIQDIAVFAKYPGLFGGTAGGLKETGNGRILTKEAVEAWFTGKNLP